MSPLPPIDCVAIRHPGQVRRRRTRAGIQKEFDYIELSLDSGSRPAKRRVSGMTGSVNCDIVSKGRGDFCGTKLIGGFRIAKKRGNSWLIFTCDWLKIVLNKNDLIKGYCYERKIAKPQLPI
jgi:hypothetical protein